MTAIIIGNGESRKELDLLRIKESNVDVTLFGCNALYRTYGPEYRVPDILVAIDDGMIAEIKKSDFPKDRVYFPPPNERWEPAECNPRRPRSNAGMAAMIHAIDRGHKQLVCIGFDFLITDPALSISNLFDGTPNYGPETRANHADNLGRAHFLNWTAIQCPHVHFIFAYPKKYELIKLFASNISTDTFDNIFED